MMKRIKRLFSLFLCLLVIGAAFDVSAANYSTYTYSYWGKPVSSPAGMEVETTYNGRQLGVGKFSEPRELYISPAGDIFVSDSGNNRILQFDASWQIKKIWKDLIGTDRQTTSLKEPIGVFVDAQDRLYIADAGNKRVVQCNMQGQILHTYVQPENDIQFTGIDYLPQRVLVDEGGYVYVLCKGIYQGALVYENSGMFTGYYGTNYVEASISSALQLLWKRLMTEEQRSKTDLVLPEEFTSFAIDDEGFIYTATEVSKTSKNQIKRINPLGVDVLEESQRISAEFQGRYGDMELRWYGGKVLQTRFVDISYDAGGFVNVLDRERGRVFQYDTEGNLIMLGGGSADQEGTFKKATAIDNCGDRIYVLDEQKANITVFKLTDYGKTVREASMMYSKGLFTESKELWEKVLRLNANCEIAYSGIGKALYEEQQYKEAMTYFKKGYDRSGYNKAFKEYRMRLMQTILPWVGSAVLVLVAGVFVYKRVRRLRTLVRRWKQ